MYFSATKIAYAAALLLVAPSALACRCSGPTDLITTDFMKDTEAVVRLFMNYGITPISGAADGYLYYVATAYKWFKGGIDNGKMIVKTHSSSATCGATLKLKDFSVLFGIVSYEEVPGFAGTVPTLTVHSCKPQKVASTISKAEWNTLFNYKEHVVCAATDCDGIQKPALDPITCPAGTEYAESAVCEGQDNGSCGWSLSGTCEKSSTPVVCGASDCDGMDKPALDPIQCPVGTEFSQSFTCEAQASNTCGWTGVGSCTPVISNDPLVCSASDCDALDKPVYDPITCPDGTDYSESSVCEAQASGTCGWTVSQSCTQTPYPDTCVFDDCDGMDKPSLSLECPPGTMYTESFVCEKQSGGGCGWTGSAKCDAVLPPDSCVEEDCAHISKPILDAPSCPTGYSFVETSSCEMQSDRCGWNISGQCQKI